MASTDIQRRLDDADAENRLLQRRLAALGS
jgi:hypothetical protein